jgi:anti-anti-sigma factor
MMDLNPTRQADVLVTRPAGHIDQAHADDFLVALRIALAGCKSDATALLIDFSAVDYISSVGLRALMLTAREAKADGIRLAVAALTPLVQEIFQISRFDLVVAVHPTLESALAALSPAAAGTARG